MALVYQADREIAEIVLAKLKADNGIAEDAQFDEYACQNLRKEVNLRDLDFLHMAGIRPIGSTLPALENYTPPGPETIETALQRLKQRGFVAADAFYNADNTQKLASQVAYRDFYFLYYLGQCAEREISSAAMGLLKQIGAIDAGAAYSEEAFEKLRQEVRAHFKIPDTAFSPVMERLLYLLASVKRPKTILGIGIFCGYTLAWIAGASCNGGKVYQADKIYGIDIDPDAIRLSKQNFGQLEDCDPVELIVEDGRVTVERLEGPFDCIYLDTDSPEDGKGLYLDLIKALYPKLSKGGWVLAHDTTLPSFQDKLKGYLDFVRDRKLFSESISFDVDLFGLELSIK
jgi:predicted O-methyltransferase YrrM